MTTSSLAHNDDSHNEISGVMPAAHQSASVAPSSDAIAASPGDSDSATTTPNTIRISIDGHDVRISPLDIADPNFSEQLLARIAAASRLVVSDWERVAALPNDPRNAFLTLATIKGPLVTIRVGETPFPDAFAATLALSVNGEDLGEVARYQEFVLEAAARCHPGAVSEAARRLRDRLRVQNLQSDDLRVLARRIREQIPNPQNSGEFTPQKAADVVLAQLQEMRALRGEDTSATPPARFSGAQSGGRRSGNPPPCNGRLGADARCLA